MRSLTTLCLIDLENIGTKAALRYMDENPEDEYIVFYSEHTLGPDSILRQAADDVSVRFIGCQVGTVNAMDFCICAIAGQESVSRDKRIVILSDDKGYDAILPMMHCQGIRIIRRRLALEPVPEQDNKPIMQAIRKHVPKKYQENVLRALPNALSYSEAHEMLQAILPQKLVQSTYLKLKPYIQQAVSNL